MFKGYFRVKRSTIFTDEEVASEKALWIQSDPLPSNITQVRLSLDKKELIIECCADDTPIEDDMLFAVDEFAVFANGQAARDYISANDVLWNEVDE